MLDLVIILGTATALSVTGLILISAMWLKKLRQTVSGAIADNASQNFQTAQRLGEAIAELQKQQISYEDQLRNLSQANAQLRQGLVNVASRLDHAARAENPRGDHTVH